MAYNSFWTWGSESDLFSLDDDNRIDHLVVCHDVDQQGFTDLGRSHDQRLCEELLELGKRLVSIL
jgi:hypothetical protein